MNKYSKNLIVLCLCAIFTITITGCKQPLDTTGPAPTTTILTEQEQEPVNQTSNEQVPELDDYKTSSMEQRWIRRPGTANSESPAGQTTNFRNIPNQKKIYLFEMAHLCSRL